MTLIRHPLFLSCAWAHLFVQRFLLVIPLYWLGLLWGGEPMIAFQRLKSTWLGRLVFYVQLFNQQIIIAICCVYILWPVDNKNSRTHWLLARLTLTSQFQNLSNFQWFTNCLRYIKFLECDKALINWCRERPLSHSRNLMYLRQLVNHWKFDRFWNWLVRVSLAKSQWVRLVKIIFRSSSLKQTCLDRLQYLGSSSNHRHCLKI